MPDVRNVVLQMPPPGMMMGGPRPPPGMYGPGGGPGGPIAGAAPVPSMPRGPVAAPPRGPVYGQSTAAAGYPGHGGPPQRQPPPGQ